MGDAVNNVDHLNARISKLETVCEKAENDLAIAKRELNDFVGDFDDQLRTKAGQAEEAARTRYEGRIKDLEGELEREDIRGKKRDEELTNLRSELSLFSRGLSQSRTIYFSGTEPVSGRLYVVLYTEKPVGEVIERLREVATRSTDHKILPISISSDNEQKGLIIEGSGIDPRIYAKILEKFDGESRHVFFSISNPTETAKLLGAASYDTINVLGLYSGVRSVLMESVLEESSRALIERSEEFSPNLELKESKRKLSGLREKLGLWSPLFEAYKDKSRRSQDEEAAVRTYLMLKHEESKIVESVRGVEEKELNPAFLNYVIVLGSDNKVILPSRWEDTKPFPRQFLPAYMKALLLDVAVHDGIESIRYSKDGWFTMSSGEKFLGDNFASLLGQDKILREARVTFEPIPFYEA